MKILSAGVFFSAMLLVLGGCSSSEKKTTNIIEAPKLEEEILLENATDAYDRGLFSVSLQSWTDLRDGYPASPYSSLAELKIADAHFYSGDYASALLGYEEFAKLHPGHEAMPYVRYQVGRSNLEQYRGMKRDQAPLQTAIKTLRQVSGEYPNSEYSVLAKRELDRAHEYLAEHEAYVAGFYLKRGYPEAAAKRLELLEERYPGTRAAETATQTLSPQLTSAPRRTGAARPLDLPVAPRIIRLQIR